MSSPALSVRSLKNRLVRMYQVALIRRAAVLAACGVMAYLAWVAVRWQPVPGTSSPLWTIPAWAKALFLVATTATLFAMFRVGGWLIRDARGLYLASSGLRSSKSGVRWYRYLNPVGPFYNLYRHRDLLGQFTRREVEGRYRGSSLGMIWSLITPLLMLVIYTFVFSVVFKARWRADSETGQGEFAVTMFAGLIAFNVFSEIVNRAPTLIVSHPNYVKKVIFPLEILPASALGAALFHALVNVAILVAASLVITGSFSIAIVLLPIMAVPLIVLSLGLGWFLASLGVYLRDVAYVVGLLTQVLFFMSAIFYPVEAVPESLRPVLHLNPLTAIAEGFRRILVWNRAPDWGAWLVVSMVGGAVFVLGYTWFMKTKAGFADVL